MAMGAGGTVGSIGTDSASSIKGLTVAHQETSFAAAVAGENQLTFSKGFYFQLSSCDRQQAKTPYGPINPQALNRYSYVLNNPIRYTDPTGHVLYLNGAEAAAFSAGLKLLASGLSTVSTLVGGIGELITTVAGAIAKAYGVAGIAAATALSSFGAAILAGIAAATLVALPILLDNFANILSTLAGYIDAANAGGQGVSITKTGAGFLKYKTKITVASLNPSITGSASVESSNPFWKLYFLGRRYDTGTECYTGMRLRWSLQNRHHAEAL